MEFDFQRYIQERKRPGADPSSAPADHGYAYGRDVRVLGTLSKARPVKLAMEASARMDAERLRAEVIGGAPPVGAEHEPRVHKLAGQAARALRYAGPPPVFVTPAVGSRDALALSIEGHSAVVIDRALLDSLDDAELLFTLGQQLGHHQNDHAVYLTTDFALEHLSENFMGWVVKPARFAIAAWRRHGQISADRAGMLACADLHVAVAALVKRHAPGVVDGSIDADHLLAEARDNPRGSLMKALDDRLAGLPQRLKALEAFSQAELFHKAQGRDGGQSVTSVDRQVEAVIKLL